MADLTLKEFEFRGKNGNTYKGLAFPGYGTGETQKPATSSFLDLAGKSSYASRYDHSHRSSQIVEYGDDQLFVNRTNRDKLYELKTQAEIDTQIAESVLNVKYQPAVNYYSQLPTNAEDGWLVPVLYDEGNHPAGDYRYHKESPDHQTGVATGWYLQSTNKVPLATETLNGLLSSSFYSYIKGLKDSGLTGLVASSTLSGSATTAARSDHQHNVSDINNFPTSLKNPYQLILKLNSGSTEGTNLFTYDGSAKKELNITPSSIGAATATDISNAVKNYLPLSGGTMTGVIHFKNNNSYIGGDDTYGTYLKYANHYLNIKTNGLFHNNVYKIWSEDNDGSGSGLDADLLDGKHASEFALEKYYSVHGSYASIGTGLANELCLNSSTSRLHINYQTAKGKPVLEYAFYRGDGTNFGNILANGFIKNGSSDNYLLTGNGGHILKSDFATNTDLSSYLPLSGGTLTGALKLNSYLFFKSPSYDNGVYLESSGNLNICAHSNYKWTKSIATINYDGTAKFNYYVDFLGGAGNSGSDIRFKNVLSDSINSVLNDTLSLKIFPYIWEKEGETHWDTFGVNADDVISLKNPIFHKMVHERDDVDKTKFVDYDRFGLIAIKAIQEITEIYEMKMKNLFDRIEKLETIIRNI